MHSQNQTNMTEKSEEKNLDIQETLSRTEHYVEKNKKNLSIALGAILALVAIYFGYQKFIQEPNEQEALSNMFAAERYFEMDSLNLAINGDGNHMGFEDILNEYGMTKAGNLAHYYLGIAFLKKGEFENAIEHLSEFDTDDEILGPVALGGIGDAYAEMGKPDEAVRYYNKASSISTNDFTTPLYLFKAGHIYRKEGKSKEALNLYERIKSEFPQSTEAGNIDKYIGLAKVSAE